MEVVSEGKFEGSYRFWSLSEVQQQETVINHRLIGDA